MKLAPLSRGARIDVLDILRGIAILLILYMNIGFQASPVTYLMGDFRLIGWTAADRITWIGIATFLEGTQRCMLEFLFAAGFMVLTRRAMRPDGPVAIADLHYRRNLWLLAFGLINVFVVLWVGDILTIYSIAALFLFPFRKLGPKLLLALGCGFALFTAVTGAIDYRERVNLIAKVEVAQAARAAGQPITADQRTALEDWQKRLDRWDPNRPPDEKTRTSLEKERKGYSGGWWNYASYLWGEWTSFMVGKGFLLIAIVEAFCAMLIGIALCKWGVIQGQRSARFYALATLLAYGFGLTARFIGGLEVTAFAPTPKTIWITAEFARLAVGLGHVTLINLIVKTAAGRTILSPFKAAGRTAFSLYFLEQIIGMHILFAPYGLNLWAKFGWADQFWIATGVIVLCLVVGNLWMRFFATGPLEWAWRSLSYVEWQPFRRQHQAAAA
ncbi:hypothetical protein BFL28_06830 [Sphingomonas turrisvirgatae]|uniref:DUF418 domain-containing protein n=2 Tax=Sphingomonas turrisvirgatae TaxID=1888892 RepID=A0A1E3LR60_9SPHN|nr:hypothetical protein BFL28_06830 [Sphingomonas turrisvirgatae]